MNYLEVDKFVNPNHYGGPQGEGTLPQGEGTLNIIMQP